MAKSLPPKSLKKVKAEIADIAKQFTNVKQYGAVADGVTDDTDAIEAAVTACLAADKVLYFPIGTYLIKRSIVMRSGMQIIGAKGATLTKAAAVTQLVQQNVAQEATEVYVVDASAYEVGQDCYLFDGDGSCYGATIGVITQIDTDTDKITFEAYKSTGALRAYNTGANTVFSSAFPLITTNHTKYAADDILIDGLTLDSNAQEDEPDGYVLAPIHTSQQSVTYPQKNVVVRNCIILNSPSDGISIQGSENAWFEHNRIDGCVAKGIHFGTQITRVTVNKNDIQNCGETAIYWCDNVTKAIVTNNFIKDCVRGCSGMDSLDKENIIAFNTFDNITEYAIWPSARTTVIGNVFQNSAGYDILVYVANYINIIGNQFYGGGANAGINIQGSNHVNVADNVFRSFTGQYAIRTRERSGGASCSNVRIAGNIIDGATMACIEIDDCTDAIVAENQLNPSGALVAISITADATDTWLNSNVFEGSISNSGTRTRINGVTEEDASGSAPDFNNYLPGEWVKETTSGALYLFHQDGNAWSKFTPDATGTKSEPEPETEYYYTEGVENIGWSEGAKSLSGGTLTYSEESDHLHITATTSVTAGVYVSTCSDVVIDLTDMATLYVEWENIGASTADNRAYINIHTEDNPNVGKYDGGQVEERGAFAKQTSSIDVSSLTGSYYIAIFARDMSTDGSAYSVVNVYNVWAEPAA